MVRVELTDLRATYGMQASADTYCFIASIKYSTHTYMDSIVTAVIVIRSRAMSYLTRQKGHSDRRLPKLTARYQLTLRLTIDSSSLPKQCPLCNDSMHVCILGTICY